MPIHEKTKEGAFIYGSFTSVVSPPHDGQTPTGKYKVPGWTPAAQGS